MAHMRAGNSTAPDNKCLASSSLALCHKLVRCLPMKAASLVKVMRMVPGPGESAGVMTQRLREGLFLDKRQGQAPH